MLNKENKSYAYNCGRMVALAEWVQYGNGTSIHDKYFTRLLKNPHSEQALAGMITSLQIYQKKASEGTRYYSKKRMGEIMANMGECGECKVNTTVDFYNGYEDENSYLWAKKEEKEKLS